MSFVPTYLIELQQYLHEFEDDLNYMRSHSYPGDKKFCEMEYKKCMSLLNSINSVNKQRVHGLLKGLVETFDYLPAYTLSGDVEEHVYNNMEKACEWYKKAADKGDAYGARCYADMLMCGNGTEINEKTALVYYSLAAYKGNPDAKFMVGELLRSVGDREGALYAYKDALAAGFEPAKVRIEQMLSGER